MQRLVASLCFTLFTIASAHGAKALPQAPSHCFNQKNYCSTVDVVRNERDDKVIRVEIFARFPKTAFSSAQELADLYFDFAKWPAYASGSDNVRFEDSQVRYSRHQGKEYQRHFAHYHTKAPWPISEMEVRDLLEYELLERPDTLMSAHYYPVAGYSDREGLKESRGQLHIIERKGRYVVKFRSEVIPSISILMRTAAPYIQRPMVDIFKGMFNLRR